MAPTLEEIHERSKGYDWEPTYHRAPAPFPSQYRIPPRGKDPFRHLLHDYALMEREKDDRLYGALDAEVRFGSIERASPRWVEALKFAVPAFVEGEYQAVKGAGLLVASVANQELRQGYAAQMLDEIRHVQIQAALRHHYVRHYRDPAGFDIGQVGIGRHPIGQVARSAFGGFSSGDPVDIAVCLNVVLETAFTNVFTMAMPEVGLANGDQALSTVMLSVQSDESRHMANGYGTLMCVLSEADNVAALQRSLDRHFWHQHMALDTLVGVVTEYHAEVRPWAYRSVFEEWVLDDFVGSYTRRLDRFGLKPPARIEDAARFVEGAHHATAIALAAIWPLNFWRVEAPGPQDYEWFEKHYPGWTQRYGGLWDAFRSLADPSSGQLLLQGLPALPPFCQVCQIPCVVPHLDAPERRVLEHEGKRYAVCSEGCEQAFTETPLRYTGQASFWSRYHGWELSEVIRDLGFVRPDGQTLIGQPHLNPDRLWRLEDIRRIGYTVKDPLAA